MPWDWGALYTTARVDLRLSAGEFWRMSMRTFFAMKQAHRKKELADMQMLAALVRGAELRTEETAEGIPAPTDWDPFDDVKF